MKKFLITTSTLLISLITFSQEKEVKIPTTQGDLEGTYLSANNETAILFISGSGPTDRDGNNSMGMKPNTMKLMADSLSDLGYASLRYDKRILAKDTNARKLESEFRFDDLVEDALFGAQWLKENGHKKIVIVGHSQGSMVGILAAQKDKDIVGLISIAGSGIPADSIIIKQFRNGGTNDLADDLSNKLDSLKDGYTIENFNPALQSILRPSVQGFLRSYIVLNPADEIAKISQPVLIINGTTDLQVDPSHADLLDQSAKDSKKIIIKGMNHVLKDAPAEQGPNILTYYNPSLPLSNGLMEGILNYLTTLN